MIRTQIQLTETQTAALKALSARTGLSMAELIRRGVDHVVETGGVDREELIRRSLASVGKFYSGLSDLAENHDHYIHGTPKWPKT